MVPWKWSEKIYENFLLFNNCLRLSNDYLCVNNVTLKMTGSLGNEWLEIHLHGLDVYHIRHSVLCLPIMIKELWMEHTMKVDLNPPVKEKEDLMYLAIFIIRVEWYKSLILVVNYFCNSLQNLLCLFWEFNKGQTKHRKNIFMFSTLDILLMSARHLHEAYYCATGLVATVLRKNAPSPPKLLPTDV